MSVFNFLTRQAVEVGYFPQLAAYDIVHGFTCRMGGTSALVPGGLNMALHVGDNKAMVLENRARVAKVMDFNPAKITTCAQVHGTKITVVTKELIGSGALDFATTIADTDGLVTAERQVPLMLFFADCVPVLLVDTKGEAIACVHAGWRGSVGSIAAKAVTVMQEQFGAQPENIVAAIGPSIGPCCYEVDSKVWEQAPVYHRCFAATRPGHWQLDLWQVNRQQLEEAGLRPEHILCAGYCTSHHVDRYFSYRAEVGKTGRLAALIYKK